MNYKLRFANRIPLLVQWIIWLWFIYFILFTCFRIVALLLFRPSGITYSSLLPSFLLGFQYDVKWIAVILLPIVFITMHKKFSPFYSDKNKRIWSFYLAIITFLVLVFFGTDLGIFSYSKTRINASVLNFSEDLLISIKTLWQSYPMLWIIAGLLLVTVLLVKLFNAIHSNTLRRKATQKSNYSRYWHIGTIFILAWCLYGLFSFTRLKWSNAFQFNDNFKSYLALNPLENFYSTLWFRTPSLKKEEAGKYFPVIADFLDLSDSNIAEKSYKRNAIPEVPLTINNPNVVLVICESFSMYKSTMSGNPLNTTPYFNNLTKQGIFFERCFTPTFGTARGLFALLTGIPDVNLAKFSTTDSEAVVQHTILNDFHGYAKYYFLGGSTEFNNFEGLIKNIEDIKIFDENSYKSPRLNVWGISDKNLFFEANNVFKEEKKPFFAIIQTADNHRPFKIPEEDIDFEKKEIPADTLKKYGFESLAEYHSFSYTDYCFKKFMEMARDQPYFDNTIFVFIGDHGVAGYADAMYPKAWTDLRLTDEHVPLLFYAPQLLKPQRRKETVSQIDVLPTIAGLLHQPYMNTTLGRDLLNTKDKLNAAFIIHRDEGNIGVVTDKYYYEKNIRTNSERLVPSSFETHDLSGPAADSIRQKLSTLTSAMYETSKWMLKNNKKE